MAYLLAADIGGTKTLLQLTTKEGELIHKQRFECCFYESFDHLLAAFLAEIEGAYPIAVASLAVAGPVEGDSAKVTNLPWVIVRTELEHRFSIETVVLCNDFEAVGYGIAGLNEQDYSTLQVGESGAGPRAVIGAGTGLGQAYMIEHAQGWKVYPTEGGHTDFAPQDSTQTRLLEHLLKRFEHVSYERLVSGEGIVTIYNFLRDYRQMEENPDCRLAMMKENAAKVISDYARDGDSLSYEAMMLFFALYGAQAGNLALTVMPKNGLYIAGGIVTKNLDLLEQSSFLDALLAKGRMRHLLERLPIRVVLDPEAGLKGAHLLARKAMYN
jgi:glucokinase